MRRVSLFRLTLVLLAIPFLVGHGLLCAVALITRENPPRPALAVVELLVDSAAWPPGWVADEPFSAHGDHQVLSDEGAEDWAQVEFTSPKGEAAGALHAIYAFADGLEAATSFYRRFPEYPRYPPVMPQGIRVWTYQSPVADRFALYCWFRGEYEDWIAIAQYGELISDLWVRLPAGGQSPPPELAKVLRTIDERMGRYLNEINPDEH